MIKNLTATYCFLFLMVLCSSNIIAQQVPENNLYTTNEHTINPAFPSISNYDAAYLSHRVQWTAFDNPPSTSYLNGHYKLNKSSGIGIDIYSDKVNMLKQQYAIIGYSRKIQKKYHKLGIGINAGMIQNKIDLSNAIVEDFSDDIFNNVNYNSSTFLTEIGLIYNYKKFEIGISIPRFIQSKVSISNGAFLNQRHYMTHANYNLSLTPNLTLTPSSLLKFINIDNYQLDINTDLNYKNKMFVGAGYRSNNSVIARAGVIINNIDIGYAYDINLSKNGFNNAVSHELRIGFKVFHPKENLIDKVVIDSNEYIIIYKSDSNVIKEYRYVNLNALSDYLLKTDSNTIISKLIKRHLENEPQLKVINLLEEQKEIIEIELVDNNGLIKKHKFINIDALNEYLIKLEQSNYKLANTIRDRFNEDPELKMLSITESNDKDNYQDSTTLVFKNAKGVIEKHRFVNIDGLNEYVVSHYDSNTIISKLTKWHLQNDPNLQLLNLVENQEEVVEIEIVDELGNIKKHTFINIENAKDYVLSLNSKNPILSHQLNEKMNADPTLNNYSNKKQSKKEQQTIFVNDSLVLILRNEKGEIEEHRFINIEAMKDFVLNHYDTNNVISKLLNWHFENDINIKILNIVEEQKESIELKIIDEQGNSKKFYFRNIESAKNYALSINNSNPKLSKDVLSQIDDIKMLPIMDTEDTFIKPEKDTTVSDLFKLEAMLEKIDVNFNLNQSQILDYKKELIEISILFDKINNYKLLIIGHTCNLGSSNTNKILSVTRATKIKNYLIENGISKSNISIIGKGESEPKVPNINEENRMMNRRVEIELIKK